MVFRGRVEPWLWMWLMAFALYAGCKWLTYRHARALAGQPHGVAAWLYLLFWPGMNAANWMSLPRGVLESGWGPAVRAACGLGLIWGCVPLLPAEAHLLRGWTGMVGVVLVLHFGVFDVLSWAWGRAGLNAPPIMASPLRSRTLAEFWGRRWNRAFHELASRYLFTPLTKRFGASTGITVVFLVSGLVHEWVITVPAGGGYGGPTLYVLLQALGMLAEKRLLRSARGVAGRLWTVAVVALPVPLLFPAVFVREIILPMLNALGAT
jgi:alginate O-acetyltransferase complex protein AlgI